ncbi:UNKNOWN [Stylonychia lemnae]|uniref:Cytoplasmic tRNA 2-thiolation protein 2 n=1 Tax=Stylonychia lemnae TaxID=5949 RepID=A0A078BB00_STYLE|nr:UNKNOWN [Stylonychia lemnae]|eukprot:CDW91371.1 UNKNOWN [Stylonychia lemnae]
MVIPEFDPCSGGDPVLTSSSQSSSSSHKHKGGCCSTNKTSESTTQSCCQGNSCACASEQIDTTTKSTQDTKPSKQATVVEDIKFRCFKCKTKRANFTTKQDKVCRECFLVMFVHRFKSSLRSNLKIWKDDLNLICISGGSNSMALIDLMYQSLFGTVSNRKMFFRVHILYIEEGSVVYGWDEEKREKNIQFIIDACNRYNFTYTILPLEYVYDISDEIDLRQIDGETVQKIEEEKKQDELAHSTPTGQDEIVNKVLEVDDILEKRQKLMTLIESLPTHSNFREDLIFYLKRWVISSFGLKYNYKKILLGTSGHKVATQLLSQLAKGRGSSIAHEISYIDDKNFGGRITFMNPMREFLHKEIALYNYLHKVDIIQQRSLAQINNPFTNSPAFGSADYLIEKFFDRLQDKFNVNTVPTVVKLTNKLLKTDFKDESNPYPFCPLCFGIRDKINNLLEMGSTIKSIKIKEDGTNEVESIKSSSDWLSSELEQAFCFGCKRMGIMASKKEQFVEFLPAVVKTNCHRTLSTIQSTL